MFRNALPFAVHEKARYPRLSPSRLKLEILLRVQSASMSHADGVIFLSAYAQSLVEDRVRPALSAVIPHGVDKRFRVERKTIRPIDTCTSTDSFRILHVSPIRAYKHHSIVVEAVAGLREQGIMVSLCGGHVRPNSKLHPAPRTRR